MRVVWTITDVLETTGGMGYEPLALYQLRVQCFALVSQHTLHCTPFSRVTKHSNSCTPAKSVWTTWMSVLTTGYVLSAKCIFLIMILHTYTYIYTHNIMEQSLLCYAWN